MFDGSFSIMEVRSIVAIVLTGLVVKSLDDWLDIEEPLTDSILALLGKGFYAYGLVAFGLAMWLDPVLALSLFIACYVVGMFGDLWDGLPSGLPGWVEGLLGLGCGFAVGAWQFIWALGVIVAVQLLDDWLDIHEDYQSGVSNLARVLGRDTAGLLFLVLFYVALIVNPLHSVIVFVTALVIGEGVFAGYRRSLRAEHRWI